VLREPTATCRARRTKNAVARCSSSSPRWQLWLFSYSVFVVGQLLLGGLVVLFLFVLSSIYHFFSAFFVGSSARTSASRPRSKRVSTWGEATIVGNGKGSRFPTA
jgi:hypothetical protein